MNLASALFSRLLEDQDFDTWANVRKHYLPSEYQTLYDVVDKHTARFHKLPSLEELKLEVRDASTLDRVYALESVEVDVEGSILLEYLKNEYAQREALYQLEKWVDSSIAFESAEEVIRHIQQIGIELEDKVELDSAEESMQRMNLFESEEEMDARIKLGFNNDFDARFDFMPTDYIMVGGERGSGKSLLCSNIANNVVETDRKALYFSIEMQPREVLQRSCSIATGIEYRKIRNRDLDVGEWLKVAEWWATRYENSEEALEGYKEHRDFNKYHAVLSKNELKNAIVDVVFDSSLTLGRVLAEVDKRISRGEEIGVIIIDYINKLKRLGGLGSTADHLDWKEQVLVSHALKTLAQERHIPVFCPFQLDKNGEARFAKGILDSCDAAFNLKAYKGEVDGISLSCVKMRGADDTEVFTSEMNWNTLKLGPRSVQPPQGGSSEPDQSKRKQGGVPANKVDGVYDF